MKISITILSVALCAAVTSASAQQESHQQWKPELRPFIGTLIPAGGLRETIGSETIYGAQGAGELTPWLHVLGTVGWAPATSRYDVANRDMDVLQYDVGAEVNSSQPIAFGLQMHAFWGAGLGARSYLYDAKELKDQSCFAAYGSTGLELQHGRTAARFEARGNSFCYKPPLEGEQSTTRYDVSFSFGLAYHFR